MTTTIYETGVSFSVNDWSVNQVPREVKEAFEQSAQYFPTPIQQFQFYDKYSRFNYDLGRRETWVETVDRVTEYLRELSNNTLSKDDYMKIREAILNMEITPSMRLLAMAGKAARRDNVTIYNCSYLPVDSLGAFREAVVISMAGCGVGYSVERMYVDQLPIVKPQRVLGKRWVKFAIPDTAEGWAEALHFGLLLWFDGYDVEFDYSQIRPAGAVLRTKGGRASGPEPLKKMLDTAREIILSRQGQKLRPIDAHDIMTLIAGSVVSGGVRRSAMLALFDYDDEEMLYAKHGDLTGKEHRWNANNSAVWPDRYMTYEEVREFMLAMHSSGRGEPGIFSRRSAVYTLPNRRQPDTFGVNPCLVGDTWLMDGDKLTKIKNGGDLWVSWHTGKKKTVILLTDAGHRIELTPDHLVQLENGEFIEAEKAEGKHIRWGLGNRAPYDRPAIWAVYGLIFIAGYTEGKKRKKIVLPVNSRHDVFKHLLAQYGFKYKEDKGYIVDYKKFVEEHPIVEVLLNSHGIPDEVMAQNANNTAGFLQGVFEIAGSVTTDGELWWDLPSEEIAQQVQIILQSFTVRCYLSFEGVFPDGREMWRLHVPPADARIYATKIRFLDNRHRNNIDYTAPYEEIPLYVYDVIEGEEKDVYDFKMHFGNPWNMANGIVCHNCGEIILRPREFCNLSAIVARSNDTEETLIEKTRLATIVGTIQAMADHFPHLSGEWKKNVQEERLLGVSLIGQMDSPVARDPKVQKKLRDVAVETNRIYAKMLGINPATAVTSVKPSGNTSLLVDTAPGIHARPYRYYIRNVRVNANSPLAWVLMDAGVPMDPENGQTWENADTYVVHFPVAAPEGAIIREELSAMEQLEYWKQVKLNYTEHNPSVTVTYRPEELDDVIRWVYEHQDIIGGMTFLPETDVRYDQMPYEKITKEEYEKLAAEFPEIDFSRIWLYEKDDRTTAAQELACMAGGKCDL